LRRQILASHEGLKELLVLGVVGQAACVSEEVTHGDRVSFGEQPWCPVLYSVVERQRPFLDQLHHHRGRERLCDARDPEAVFWGKRPLVL
jgi:hypothetical protein